MTDPERFHAKVDGMLESADVRIGGGRPWDLIVHEPRFFARILSQGSLGLGESYMDGWWECERLDEFFHRVLAAELDRQVRGWADVADVFAAKVRNLQAPSRAFEVGRRHYDVGNDLYRRMLDGRMVYSCGYWAGSSDLGAAQEAKLDLVCRKLGLQPGMKVLDIGCGWGGAARFAAERYGVTVVGLTVSEQQATFAAERCREWPVEIRLQDYRELEGSYDRVFSLGMFEHVGRKNYRTYFEVVRNHLAPDGLFLLHTIGANVSSAVTDPWMARYIFPNSMVPSAAQITAALEGLFVMEDWHNFGTDYDRTLLAWHRNFEEAWGELRDRYGERFRRMWTYYLLASAGSFRARKNQVWQLVLSPRGVPGGYTAPR
ncbi:MAG: cyclopropane fatty acyl phospholipid synthase [Deltaproteobacteria bacterium]|nr:cyclopropane fatty acyl phospholipid synthase [Deltaproteobacteria bacterium]